MSGPESTRVIDLRQLPWERAPDGAWVRPLYRTSRASAAEFVLPAGSVTRAVAHRTVDEFWQVIAGTGTLWHAPEGEDTYLALAPDVNIALACGTPFQFRAEHELRIFAVTVPPWPRDPDGAGSEARLVQGPWVSLVDGT